jgi:hypothetical protein
MDLKDEDMVGLHDMSMAPGERLNVKKIRTNLKQM